MTNLPKINIAASGASIRIFSPLASEIGLSPSILLLQLDWWFNNGEGYKDNGKWFLSMSTREMQRRALIFWTPQTILNNIRKLEKMGLIEIKDSESSEKPPRIELKYTSLNRLKSITVSNISTHNCKKEQEPVKKLDSTRPEIRQLTSKKLDTLDNIDDSKKDEVLASSDARTPSSEDLPESEEQLEIVKKALRKRIRKYQSNRYKNNDIHKFAKMWIKAKFPFDDVFMDECIELHFKESKWIEEKGNVIWPPNFEKMIGYAQVLVRRSGIGNSASQNGYRAAQSDCQICAGAPIQSNGKRILCACQQPGVFSDYAILSKEHLNIQEYDQHPYQLRFVMKGNI